MYAALKGIRVVEVATWTFVPAAGAVLADWGADVVKVEHPATGDPQRGLVVGGLTPEQAATVMIGHPNRGKRSVGLDISRPEGRDVLRRLVVGADVFLTNYLPAARRKLQVDLDDLREVNPRLVYVRGSGQGVRGPDAERGGFDLASAWSRAGIGYKLTDPAYTEPVRQPPAFVDLAGGLALAGGIAAALFERERTGVAPVVDVSLFGVGSWMMAPDILGGSHLGGSLPLRSRTDANNPLVNAFPTKDGRWLNLVLLQSDRYWPELCAHLGRRDLVDDPRFADARARHAHRSECVAELDAIFRTRTLDEWCDALATMEGVWAPLRAPGEVPADPQAIANGVLADVGSGPERVVASPVQFDERPLGTVPAAPGLGADTDEVLGELGIDGDELLSLKLADVVS